ncbi:uncharacterized protein LOC135923726 isoform X1 [Gordionus sp. m RMFG-2023]|uniref:uncharacterized protein LOC135923726 isoform X1 n=2 Tax=Gordionus sp. m RMFG-2023 TaxID=3053472 RepID=UPI0031FC5BFB
MTLLQMLAVGTTFDSYEELRTAVNNYEKHVKTNYSISRSDTLKNTSEEVKKRYLYRRIHFACIQGGFYRGHGKGQRNTKTLKINCTSKIAVRFIHQKGEDKLVVINLNEIHNHDLDNSLFIRLPKQRRLSDEEKEYVIAGLKHDDDISKIQSHINKSGKVITKRDLYNMKRDLYHGKRDQRIKNKNTIPFITPNELTLCVETVKRDNPENIIEIIAEDATHRGLHLQENAIENNGGKDNDVANHNINDHMTKSEKFKHFQELALKMSTFASELPINLYTKYYTNFFNLYEAKGNIVEEPHKEKDIAQDSRAILHDLPQLKSIKMPSSRNLLPINNISTNFTTSNISSEIQNHILDKPNNIQLLKTTAQNISTISVHSGLTNTTIPNSTSINVSNIYFKALTKKLSH